jgi:UDP-N-acetylglucosamine diphosphorylase/glucosamine-1-phosphate N-acetyltransferase
MLTRDGPRFRGVHGFRPLPPHVAVTGPLDRFVVAEDASIEPFVFVDTRGGPVLIDRGAFVNSFSRLEGPCYIGRDSWIVGAKLRGGTTIGPGCKIGGEVEASIVQGFSNKYHEGFLGHSYIGEWVNLAAATQTSDLRNDYDVVRATIDGHRVVTGRTKVGAYIGDHVKTGLGAMLNTGTTVGPFANVLPAGSLLPPVIPAFSRTHHGGFQEITDLRKTFTTAGRVMQRRGKVLTDEHREFYYNLFESTAERRREMMRAADMRRLKRSI